MSESAAIRVENLTKRYRGQTALDRVSFEVPMGSVFGLLGENGAGKTTTIQIVLGLVPPDEGRAETLGLNPATAGVEVRRRVGYVPEQATLYDWMTVAEIGWFAAGFHAEPEGGTSPYLNRYRSMAEGFELPLHRKIRHLSKGMKAKASLSLALASEPKLLVLDEPTSGLDVLVRRDFLESMVDLAGEGRTVLLSSHQIGEVERVASHVGLIHHGHLILAEPLDELRARTFVLTLSHSDSVCPLLAPPPSIPLELVDVQEGPRQTRWLVHASDVMACEAVRSLPGVEELEIETPGLEEIYIGYMRRRTPTGAEPAVIASAQA
jgi:ABC-2 type transport system ATP-binding protein